MSILFCKPSGDVIWNPSSDSARVFLAQVRALEDMVGASGGMTDIRSDEVTVDTEQFVAFTEALSSRAMQSAGGSTFRFLVDGCLSICLALASELSPELPVSESLKELRMVGQRQVKGYSEH